MRVQAYRNLRYPEPTYSLRDPRTGRVLAHRDDLYVLDAVLRVQPGGQARARQQGQRNVHAFVDGTLTDQDPSRPGDVWRLAHYNPFTTDTFVDADTATPVLHVRAAHLGAAGLHYLPAPA